MCCIINITHMEALFRDYYKDKVFGNDRTWLDVKKDARNKWEKRDWDAWTSRQADTQINTKPIALNRVVYHPITADFGAYQMDITFYEQYEKLKGNKNYSSILCIIEISSRYVYCYPLKTKTSEEVLARFKEFREEAYPKIKELDVDDGNEFKGVLGYCEEHDIKTNVYSTDKTSMGKVERFNRTLRDMISNYKESTHGVWVPSLPLLVKKYNDTVHRSTKLKPNEVDAKMAEDIQDLTINRWLRAKQLLHQFHVGDRVRFIKHKNMFGKGAARKYSSEVLPIFHMEGNLVYLEGKEKPFKYWELLPVRELDTDTGDANELEKEREKHEAVHISRVARKLKTEEKMTDKKLRDYKDDVKETLVNATSGRPERSRRQAVGFQGFF